VSNRFSLPSPTGFSRRDAAVVAEDAVHVPDRLVARPVVVIGFEKHAVQVHPARIADVPQQRQAPVNGPARSVDALEVLLVAPRPDAQRDLRLARPSPTTAGRRKEEAAVARETGVAVAPTTS
jgi:hypothetical protein